MIRRRLDDFGGDRPPDVDGIPAWVSDDAPCLWKNAELSVYLRETIKEMGERNPILDDRFRMRIVPGLRHYRIPEHILAIRSATREFDRKTVLRCNVVEIDFEDRAYRMRHGYHVNCAWDRFENQYVTHFLLDERDGYLTVYPTPTEHDWLKLFVERTYDLDACQPDCLPDELRPTTLVLDVLVSGTCMRAFKNRDADDGDRNKFAEFSNEFRELCGPARSLHGVIAIRKWGERLPRVTPRTNFV